MSGREIEVSKRGERLRAMTLEQLFAEAEIYGNVDIYSDRRKAPPRCYSCTIRFDSIPGTELNVASDFGLTIAAALVQAIDRAGRVVAEMGRRTSPTAQQGE